MRRIDRMSSSLRKAVVTLSKDNAATEDYKTLLPAEGIKEQLLMDKIILSAEEIKWGEYDVSKGLNRLDTFKAFDKKASFPEEYEISGQLRYFETENGDCLQYDNRKEGEAEPLWTEVNISLDFEVHKILISKHIPKPIKIPEDFPDKTKKEIACLDKIRSFLKVMCDREWYNEVNSEVFSRFRID